MATVQPSGVTKQGISKRTLVSRADGEGRLREGEDAAECRRHIWKWGADHLLTATKGKTAGFYGTEGIHPVFWWKRGSALLEICFGEQISSIKSGCFPLSGCNAHSMPLIPTYVSCTLPRPLLPAGWVHPGGRKNLLTGWSPNHVQWICPHYNLLVDASSVYIFL